jgi:glycosyltransferase involved in cell wall biosynthesis
MRIAYVYDALYPYVTGGAERRYYELGRRMAQRGHDVHIVSWDYGAPREPRAHAGMTVHAAGRAPSLHDDEGRRTFREALAFAVRAVPALARLDVDVIDCSSIPYVPAFTAAARRRLRPARLVVTWHEYMGERWPGYLRHGAMLAQRNERAAAAVGDERVAVSAFTKRRLPLGPLTSVVTNGIDLRAIRDATPAPDHADVVVAGRLVPHKRTELLIDALVRAPGVTALVIGDGPERPALEGRAREQGVADRVRFAGWLDDVAEVYAHFRGAAAVLVTSEQEGFAMTVIEAQAAGAVPVVARSPFSAAPDLVADGETGIIVDPDAGAIAEALRRLTAPSQECARMRASAMASVARYDWHVVAERMERVYEGRRVREIRIVREEQAA